MDFTDMPVVNVFWENAAPLSAETSISVNITLGVVPAKAGEH